MMLKKMRFLLFPLIQRIPRFLFHPHIGESFRVSAACSKNLLV